MESNQVGETFTEEEKEYLQGFFAGVTARTFSPFVGQLPNGRFTAQTGPGVENLATQPSDHTVFGAPISDLCEQETWKLERHGLDIWDKLLAHAEENKFPDKADTFRFRYHGLFYVAPTQDSFMLRCRIAAGQLTAEQFKGLSEIAEDWGKGYADVTTRANIQIREIAPKHIVKVLLKLQELGLTSRGSGVDNVRKITASPTAGIDPSEMINTQPYAKAVHYYILNNRDLYDLPRKFNVAFDGGGSVSVVADTNDIGFVATKVKDGEEVPAGTYFRVHLAGITGHQQFGADAGILVRPEQSVAVAAAIIRVFIEHGDRTNRKKARLKYLIDRWGIPKFLEETEKKLSFPLLFFPLEKCVPPHPPVLHGHLGVYKLSQKNRNYIGVAIPVGRLRVRQMRRIADLARNYGSGDLRLTVWQNLILPDIADGFVETVKRSLVRIGLHYEAASITGGVIACTANTGCNFAATNTKGQAVELARHLERTIHLDQPINIHLTGCPNSCAQHFIGDISLLGVKIGQNENQREGYHVFFGGRAGYKQQLAKPVFHNVPFSELPTLLEKVMKIYLERRLGNESFIQFVSRHEAPNSCRTSFPTSRRLKYFGRPREQNAMTLDRPQLVPLVPENAPFSPTQRAWLNGFLAGLFSQTNLEPQPDTPRKKIPIYYGSETGTAEAFAQRVAKAAVQRGFESAAICMEKVNLSSLASQEFALFVTSTYGDGDPPANAKAFHAELMQPPPGFSLSHLQFSVLALGEWRKMEYSRVWTRLFHETRTTKFTFNIAYRIMPKMSGIGSSVAPTSTSAVTPSAWPKMSITRFAKFAELWPTCPMIRPKST